MRRLRVVTGSLTYYLVCNQLVSLFSSNCFALLPAYSRRSFCRKYRRRFCQPRGVLCRASSSPYCSRYRSDACFFIIASTSSSSATKKDSSFNSIIQQEYNSQFLLAECLNASTIGSRDKKSTHWRHLYGTPLVERINVKTLKRFLANLIHYNWVALAQDGQKIAEPGFRLRYTASLAKSTNVNTLKRLFIKVGPIGS